MRAEHLDLRELLELDPSGGIVRFAGQRALILDAVALGLLRKELFGTIGAAGARGVLTRFGFAHGWRVAETLEQSFPWDSRDEWRRAGGRLHRLQGVVVFEPVVREPGESGPFAEAIWKESYEAEQHLLHLGIAEEPICWTLVGFASGYLSYGNGREIYCVETQCRGRGDAVCRMVGEHREDWGQAIAPHLPFYDKDCLSEALKELTRALARTERKLRKSRRELAGGEEEAAAGLVAQSDGMKTVVDLARRAAAVDVTVLITGESGVGKERVARLIHDRSPRAARPLVAVNCGAVAETLLESELFGHVRGAFTGASTDRIGLFEAASGGTLFLDEIGELSPAMQVKLLRALAEREIRRVGETRSRPVDVRIVAATNRDLAAEVGAGRFREDLYYRLKVVEIRIPPLRERKDDILPLARMMLAMSGERMGKRGVGLSPKAADQLLRYHWPGNIRELQNAVERALVVADGACVEAAELPEEVRGAAPVARLSGVRTLAEIEREAIFEALARHGGNRSRAAEELGIARATLLRKLKEYESGGA